MRHWEMRGSAASWEECRPHHEGCLPQRIAGRRSGGCRIGWGILGTKIERVVFPEPRTRGWQGVLNAAGLTLRYLHYRTDAEALVVTLDADESPIHRHIGQGSGPCDVKCRLCQLRSIIEMTQCGLKPRQGGPIRVALGIAIPALEAWCLCGTDPHITEAAWAQALPSRRFPYTKNELKLRLYGTVKPVLSLETRLAVEQAERLVQQNQLAFMEKVFPVGFGSLAGEIRGWQS